MNYGAGQVVPNAALAKVGADGKVCIYSLGAAHVIADVSGFVPGASGQGPTTTLPGSGTTLPGGGTTTLPGGGTTTTVPQAGGIGTFLDPGFYGQQLAAGPDGRMHLAFEDGYAQRVNYGSCTANCHVPGNWNVVELLDEATLPNTLTIGPSGLGVDASGRVHMLVEGVESGGEGLELRYYTCASNCSVKASWTFTDLSSISRRLHHDQHQQDLHGAAFRQGVVPVGHRRLLRVLSDVFELRQLDAGFHRSTTPKNAVVDSDGVTHAFIYPGAEAAATTCSSTPAVNRAARVRQLVRLDLGFLTKGTLYTITLDISDAGRLYLGFQQGTCHWFRRSRTTVVTPCSVATRPTTPSTAST